MFVADLNCLVCGFDELVIWYLPVFDGFLALCICDWLWLLILGCTLVVCVGLVNSVDYYLVVIVGC